MRPSDQFIAIFLTFAIIKGIIKDIEIRYQDPET